MTIRSDWRKLFRGANRLQTDFSVSPVHEIADDIDDGGGGTPTLEPLVTGITTEYATSELIFDEDGDIVTDG